MLLCFFYLHCLLLPGWPVQSKLVQTVWRWSRFFSMTKCDVDRTGPPYQVKLRIRILYKGYVPRRTLAAIQAILNEVQKMQLADLIEKSDSP